MKKINVLVTGAGSGVGQSIVKALKISKLNLHIISADINELNAGLYRANKGLIIPKVEKKNSLNEFIKIFRKNKIDIVFIGSEIEINFFSKYKDVIYEKSKTVISVTNQDVIKIADDKFKTIEFFKKNKLNFPKSYIINTNANLNSIFNKLKKPFILKSRFGTSGRSVFVINNKKEFFNKISLTKHPMAQEYLGKKNPFFDEEYTCSIFTDKNEKLIGPFMSQRILKNGTSWVLKTFKNKRLEDLVIQIAKKTKNKGTINIQFKKHNNKFIPFEINSRFSGTTSIRAAFGFNEPELFIKSFYLNQNLKDIMIKKGFVFRYVEEIFLKTDKISKLKKNFSKGIKKQWF